MVQHELVLLSPYRFPGQSSMMLGNEDMAAWLNAYTALWHPVLVWNAKGPPRCDAQYDHEQPRAGFVFAVPESPPLYLPDDWDERVRAVGSIAFRAGTDRAATLENLRVALTQAGQNALGWAAGLSLEPERIAPFFGLGMGHLLEVTLAEAMEHENLLEAASFWDDVQEAVARLAGFSYTRSGVAAPAYNPETSAYPSYESEGTAASQEWDTSAAPRLDNVPAPEMQGSQLQENSAGEAAPDPDEWRTHLRNAAQKLLSAREVLYPVAIHLLDLNVLDDKALDQAWPASLQAGLPLNVIASASVLEKMSHDQPAKFEALRTAVQAEEAEVCGGCYLEREDPLLGIDSQLWNLQKGLAVARSLLQADIRVFARKRFGYHPQMPLLLSTVGLQRALFLCFDESSGVPQYTACVVAWPAPDGKQVDAFVRAPYPADNPSTFFNFGHYWFKTTREDHAATIALSHTGQPACPWYRDLTELARLAPVLGSWTTFSRYFNDVMAGEHPPALSADEFHSDFLSERTGAHVVNPVSSFASHLRARRRVDACWTFAALQHSLSGGKDPLVVNAELQQLEDALERQPGLPLPGLDELEKRIAASLAERLQVRAAAGQPGTMLLNPCAFARRVTLELDGAARPLAVGGQIKACQLDGSLLRVVVEVPALGFAWIPKEGPPGTQPMVARMRLGDPAARMIRNEFFEAEVDAGTGSLKAIRDHKTRVNRLGQRLVFNPGSRMVAKDIKVTSSGPALGEIVSEGELLGEQNQVLATFKQRLRAWLGRPLLEMRIELKPVQPAAGYPWHAYFGSRFAWRDERGILLRGVGGSTHVTTHTRPQTPDFLELRLGRLGTVIFPGGLPFHQRHEGRMLDVILQPEGEEATTFDLGIALDRDMPMQTALGLTSPIAIVPTTKGPPHVGTSGWLFHLDAPNLLMTRMVPGPLEIREGEPPSQDAVTARLLECAGHSGHAEFRCVRNPKRAVLLDARGRFLLEASPAGDAVLLEVSPNDMVHVQVEFS
jgi:hypothetical protein